MTTGLHHPALLQHDNAVGALDGRQPVRDHQHGAVAANLFDGVENAVFAARIQMRGCLVEDQQLAVAQHGAGDGDALALATGEALPR